MNGRLGSVSETSIRTSGKRSGFAARVMGKPVRKESRGRCEVGIAIEGNNMWRRRGRALRVGGGG